MSHRHCSFSLPLSSTDDDHDDREDCRPKYKLVQVKDCAGHRVCDGGGYLSAFASWLRWAFGRWQVYGSRDSRPSKVRFPEYLFVSVVRRGGDVSVVLQETSPPPSGSPNTRFRGTPWTGEAATKSYPISLRIHDFFRHRFSWYNTSPNESSSARPLLSVQL